MTLLKFRLHRSCLPGTQWSGQTLVEYAIGLTFTLYLLMGVVDFGRAFIAYNGVASTAREGARYGVLPGRTATQIDTYATAKAPLSGTTVSCTSGCPTVGGATVVVQASYSFDAITPLISQICCSGGSLVVTSSASMKVEPY